MVHSDELDGCAIYLLCCVISLPSIQLTLTAGSIRDMIRKALIVAASALVLAACSPTVKYSSKDPQRGLVTQASDTLNKGARYDAPVMLRIIKEIRQLELWKQDRDGTWIRVKSYEICAFSGQPGPKKRQGDYQAPEGFYEITASQLNPFSSYHLAINTGYPNRYDRAHFYSGAALMIHGGCSSAGCYAMTDPNIEEIYAAVRDAIKGGQKTVQLQIYPFSMDWLNLFAYRNDPNYKFWTELKAGWDWFEKNKQPIPVDIRDGKYYIKS